MINQYQAKYFAYELSKKASSDSPEKFGATLMDAKVELYPHQVEAALFAFKSSYSIGAILADEVGLEKTIEAERDQMILDAKNKLNRTITEKGVFTISFELV